MSEKISSKKVVSGITWTIAERMLTEIVGSLISIILGRILLVEDYGTVGLVQIFITISSIFVTNGLGSALVQNKDTDEEQESTVFYLNLAIGLLLYAVLFFSAPLIAKNRNNLSLIQIIRVLGLKVPLASIYSLQNAYIKKRMEFKKFFYSSLIGTIVSGIIGVYMAIKGYGPWALVASTLIDQAIDIVILFLSSGWLPALKFNYKKSKKLINFGLKVLLTELIGRLYEQSRPLVIGFKYSTSDLAYSVKGQKFTLMITELCNSTIIKVMLPVFSSVQDKKEELQDYLRKSISITSFFLIPMMLGLFCVADNFVPLILTEKWNNCIPYLRLYCLIYMISPIYALDRRIIEACGAGNYLVKTQALTTSLELITLIIVVLKSNSAIYILVNMLLMSVVSILINIAACKRLIGFGFLDHFNSIKKTLFVAIVMGIIVLFVGKAISNYLVSLIVQVVIGVIIYVVLSLLVKNEAAKIILEYLKTLKKQRVSRA